MSRYIKFDFDAEASMQETIPAPFATFATPQEHSSENSKSSRGTSPRAQCFTFKGEEQLSKAPEKRNTQHSAEKAAIFATPATPADKSSKSSNPEPLTQYYSCLVCGRPQRWDDRGIWRCRPCWPDPLTATAHADEQAERARLAVEVNVRTALPRTKPRDPRLGPILPPCVACGALQYWHDHARDVWQCWACVPPEVRLD
jgi:hypothetical protein